MCEPLFAEAVSSSASAGGALVCNDPWPPLGEMLHQGFDNTRKKCMRWYDDVRIVDLAADMSPGTSSWSTFEDISILPVPISAASAALWTLNPRDWSQIAEISYWNRLYVTWVTWPFPHPSLTDLCTVPLGSFRIPWANQGRETRTPGDFSSRLHIYIHTYICIYIYTHNYILAQFVRFWQATASCQSCLESSCG